MAKVINIENINRYLDYGQEVHDIKQASDWSSEVIDLIMNPESSQTGLGIHYVNYNDSLRFRPQEVSIWAGINGHGKSMVLSQFILAGMFEAKFGTISPEMTPLRQLQRLTFQACRMRHPNPDQAQAFHRFTDDRLWFYDQQGRVSKPMLFACMRYMAIELGITHIIIDSLMKCIHKEDDYNEQKEFVNDLCQVAKDLNVHIHLVCHSRKSESEKKMPDKFDIKGTGAITDLVDNVLIVWRNKGKEAQLNKKNLSDSDRRKVEDAPDSALICVKQRHYDWEGVINLNYHAPSLLLLNGVKEPVHVDWVAVNGERQAG